MSIEAIVINHILTTRDISIVSRGQLDKKYFPGYEEEFQYLIEENTKYNKVPDISTFLHEFPDFEYFKVDEPVESLLDKLSEERGYPLVIKALEDINEAARTNTIRAAEIMVSRGQGILDEVNKSKVKGKDLIRCAEERAKDYIRRRDNKGLIGISTGIPELDKLTKGWQEVDYVTIGGRTQEGKSWVVLYFLIQAWLQGKRVGLFDLENGVTLTGFRFDTFLGNFSNEGLLDGETALAWEDGHPILSDDDYLTYIDDLGRRDVPFKIYDSQMFSGGYTPELIEEIIKEEGFDIVGIDQVSLVVPSKRVRSLREGYVSNTRFFRQLTNRLKIPIIQLSQANREYAKGRQKDVDASPELHHLAESDSIAQDSLRVITIRALDGLLKLSLRKNTYGLSNRDVLLRWDIDRGIIKPIDIKDGMF